MKIDIGIPEEQRKQVADGLSRLLADSYILYLKTHAFHWNVEGPMFQTLHVLFMEQYTEIWTALDEIAERIRALGFPAPGSYREFAELSDMEETVGAPAAKEMIALLVAGNEAVARTCRSLFPITEEAKDEVSNDLLIGRMTVHEKTAWMLRSLLKE